MPSKTVFLKSFAASGVIALSLAMAGPAAWGAAAMSTIDTNNDGSISLQEAHTAAEKKFDKMDKDHDGKIEMKEASPMSKAITEMARHDKDHAIDKEEYMSGVDAAFKEADPKGTGVLDAQALKTKAGRHFLDLVE